MCGLLLGGYPWARCGQARNTTTLAAENLRLVVKETRQAYSVRFLRSAAGYQAAATLVFMLLAKGARGVRPCQARTSAASQQASKGSLR